MEDMDTDTPSTPEALFRPPVKRRKFLRRRAEDIQEHDEPQPISPAPHPPQEAQDTVHPPDLLRLRRLNRARKGGIEFSATSRQTTGKESQTGMAMATAEDLEAEKIKTMCDRFTVHTGQTVDVDKHMMAYIDSEMAKRHRSTLQSDATDPDTPGTSKVDSAPSTTDLPQREPASLGKLHEIDLGHETKLENIARTEAATRKLVGDDEDVRLADGDPVSTIAPIDKSERHWRSRKRRTSEDVERDRLVEEVLRESKLDVYDEPAEEAAAADGQAADDRVAEQFRRDFLDAIQSRRRVARAKNTKTTKPEAPRGPKLGGSRSARAAMREMQEKSTRK